MDGSSTSGRTAWKIGDILAGRYKITGVLGAGGMGKVYKAWDEQLGREVALKTLTSANLIDQEVVRFQREAQAASHLRHASVIDCFDFGVLESGQPYMVMEYINGVTLKNVLKRDGAFDADYVLSILQLLTDGLTAIHRAGIVHRDLNLGNIMLIESGTEFSVKILDFGIARRELPLSEASLTRKDAIIGNPLYMSPEQARGEVVDERSDIYSLGCIAFELLSGAPPFRAGNALATIKLHADEDLPPLASMLTREQPCVELLDSMLRLATAKAVEERFQSAEKFKEEVVRVRRAVQDFRTAEQRETQIKKTTKKLSTKMVAAMSAISIVALAAIGLALPHTINLFFPPVKKTKVPKLSSLFADSMSKPEEDVTRAYEEESKMINTHQEDESTGQMNTRLYFGKDALKRFRKDVEKGLKINDLVFKKVPLTNADVKAIAKLKPTVLLFSATGIDDESLQIISQMKDVSDLRMCEEKKITAAGLKSLSKLKLLWMLVLVDMDLDDEATTVLKTFPSLQQLSLEKNRRVTSKGLENLAKCKTLRQIAIGGCACSAIPTATVAAFEREHNIRLLTNIVWSDPEGMLEDVKKADSLFPL